jgi:uncharacterized membrane protein
MTGTFWLSLGLLAVVAIVLLVGLIFAGAASLRSQDDDEDGDE